jgi:hypothetical protein
MKELMKAKLMGIINRKKILGLLFVGFLIVLLGIVIYDLLFPSKSIPSPAYWLTPTPINSETRFDVSALLG